MQIDVFKYNSINYLKKVKKVLDQFIHTNFICINYTSQKYI